MQVSMKLQSQQAGSCILTPQTVWALGSAPHHYPRLLRAHCIKLRSLSFSLQFDGYNLIFGGGGVLAKMKCLDT